MKKSAVVLLLFALPVLIIIGLILFSGGGSVTPPPRTPVSIWGSVPQSTIQPALNAYQSQSQHVAIAYTQVQSEGLRERLLEAWALGVGPDIVMLPSNRLTEYQPFLTPAPPTTPQYTFTTTKTLGIKEETTVVRTDIPGPTPSTLRTDFIDTVSSDMVIASSVYGLPIGIDTLVLYSNRDLLNRARIPLPASTWDEFVQQVPRLTILDDEGQIIQSGATIGTADNIRHSIEILSLLYYQNGTAIFNTATGQVTLTDTAPSQQALNFYTDFSRKSKVVYSWNDDQESALNAFAEGKVAYYIGFPGDETDIKTRAVGLNYDISAMPQINPLQPVNLATYDALTVSKSSKNAATAWNVVQFLASRNASALYVNASGKTPARKDLINEVLTTESAASYYGTLAGQALTAKSWYRGPSVDKTESAIKDLIRSVVNGVGTADAINAAVQQLRLIQS